jgi:hypothetical protein
MCYVSAKQFTNMSVWSANRLVLVVEAKCILHDAETEFACVTDMIFGLKWWQLIQLLDVMYSCKLKFEKSVVLCGGGW